MKQPGFNTISGYWQNLILGLSVSGRSVALGLFDRSGNLLFANHPMCHYLDTGPDTLQYKNQFVNPGFGTFFDSDHDGLQFEGYLTLGNYRDISYVLYAKAYRRHEELFVFAEADVLSLFEDNKKMSILNQDVNNLQRQLIKEKKQLEFITEELKTRTIELEKANRELVEINNEKNRYIGMVAHDLRSPIGMAESFSHLLIDEIDEIERERMIKYLGIINERCAFSLDLIHDFLNISKIEAGIIELNLTEQEYISFIKENIVQEELLAKSKSQSIQFRSNVDMVFFSFDKNKIRQVMSNLISNAIKYSQNGTTITIDIDFSNGQLLTAVIDQGQGIPSGELNRLFIPFQITSTKPTANEKSTGLGLAIVKKIVEAHGGKVWVESEVGKGSKFCFSISKNFVN